ncbi:MAG: DUF3971 domain-containing protein [Acidiferrobacterales bacterium]|nr:DUF3971 domain-containing protein [Acidiferrobacterales bacterium]
MNTFLNLSGRISHKLLVIFLRIIALASSFVLLIVLCLALAVTNVDSFTPWLLSEAASRSDGRFSFDQIDFSFRESLPEFEIHGLSVTRELDEGSILLSADAVQVRLASPLLTSEGVQIDQIGIANPSVDASISVASGRKSSETSAMGALALNSLFLSALQSNVRTIDISDGSFGVLLDSQDLDVRVLGDFSLETTHTDQGVSMVGKVESELRNQSVFSFRLDLTEPVDESTMSKFEIDVDSLDAAWLAAAWTISDAGKTKIDPTALTAVADAHINGEIVDGHVESVNWTVEMRDPQLDGDIPDSTETIASIKGSWEADDTGNRVNTEFELVNLDAKRILDLYPTVFPPKFYKHMSERLDSLWVRRATGTFAGDPMNAILHKDFEQLNVDGDFQNVNFVYGNKWPALQDGNGTFKVRGKRLDVAGSSGVIYGEPIGELTGYIEDFTVSDPILNLSAEMDVPMPMLFDFFGPDGIVLPGKTQGIAEGSGTGNVSLSVVVPLRRGKEYLIEGVARPGDISAVTEYGLEVSQIQGQVNFDRIGITSGELSAKAVGGDFKTQFYGSGTKGNYVVQGTATGSSAAAELGPIIGSALGSKLSGSFEWRADYSFEPNENTIAFSSPLTGLDSALPFPLKKGPGLPVPLRANIRTVDGTEREFDFDLASIVSGKLNATLSNRTWNIHSGSLAIGDADPIGTPSPGVRLALSLPELNYEDWSNLFADNESQSKLQLESLQIVKAQLGSAIMARGRRLNGVSATIEKKDKSWAIEIESDEVAGTADFRSTDFLQEGEYPHLTVRLSKCHIPEAQSDPPERSVNPRNVPNLDFSCSDLRYGQYHFGDSVIQAKATNDSWHIESAKFQTPSLSIVATGDWKYDQSTRIDFRFNSADLGAAMSQLGYPGKFDSGAINLSGYLTWNDALTKWQPNLTSGEVGFVAKDGTVVDAANNPSTAVVGVLNYDTLLQRISVDVSDILKGGIAFHSIEGKMTVVDGIILVDGVRLNSPSVEIVIQGSTDWTRKEHRLVAGARSNVGKSLTTIATLINPVQGLLTYLAQEFLEEMDVELFKLQYQIRGPWDAPEVEVVNTQILAPVDPDQS